MSSVINVFITADKLKVLLDTVTKKGEKGIALDVFTSDVPNEYGQNASVAVAQTKAQREAKTKRYYVGNGRVAWTDGTIIEGPKKGNKGEDDLPF